MHMCQSVEGPLMNWKKKDWNAATKWMTLNGQKVTGDELKQYFIQMLGEGWKVLPMCDCEDFDKEHGCMDGRSKQMIGG